MVASPCEYLVAGWNGDGVVIKTEDISRPGRGRHRAVISRRLSDDVCDPGLAAIDRRDRASLPDNRVHTLLRLSQPLAVVMAPPAILRHSRNGCASNHGRASIHRQ